MHNQNCTIAWQSSRFRDAEEHTNFIDSSDPVRGALASVEVRIQKRNMKCTLSCMEATRSHSAANSFTHVSSLVIINKPLLFFGVQSATPPKTPQEAKNDVSMLCS